MVREIYRTCNHNTADKLYPLRNYIKAEMIGYDAPFGNFSALDLIMDNIEYLIWYEFKFKFNNSMV